MCYAEKCVMLRNVEKCQASLLCGGISPHEQCKMWRISGMWRNFFSSTLRLIRISVMLRNYIILLQTMLFCCNLRCFVTKSVLSRFTRCVEKNFTKNCACGEKRQISCMLILSPKYCNTVFFNVRVLQSPLTKGLYCSEL